MPYVTCAKLACGRFKTSIARRNFELEAEFSLNCPRDTS